MNLHRLHPRSTRSARPFRWLRLTGYSLGVATSGATLLLLAWIVGRKSPEPPRGAFEAILVSASSPGAAVAIACAALVLGTWSLRHVVLHWLAWLPGRIEVSRFAAGTELFGADPEQLTVRFRQRLSTLRLQAPTPLPGATPEGEFVDVLSRSGIDPRNPAGALLTLIRAAKPSHAYEVSGVLLERPERPRYGVAIEVSRRPSESLMSKTVWGATWDRALTEAADEATSAILPRTRHCRAPWTGWRGRDRPMPPRLLHNFEEGARLEQERRYDEALHAYGRAVDADPMNMVLRLRVGQLQERMGLYLDALATYIGMDVASGAGGARPRRGGPGANERRTALQSARYRRNVLLGGKVLAKQWWRPPDDPRTLRDERRAQLRTCLRPKLLKRLLPSGSGDTHGKALGDPECKGKHRREYLELRRLFAEHAQRDCEALRKELRRRPIDRGKLTTASIRLTEVCIGLRLRWVEHELRERDVQPPDTPPRWPPDPDQLAAQIAAIERGVARRLPEWATRWRTFRLWHEHYNAACAFALVLQDDETVGGDKLRATLAERAVCRLRRAMSRADGSFIASRRDWLVGEDPDLVGLRAQPEFREFEMDFLPGAELTPPRPACAYKLESAYYVRSLLVATASEWHATWHRRAAEARRGTDIHRLHDWFGDERRTWAGVGSVARQHRHPASRWELIRDMSDCAERYGFAPPSVRFPRYDCELTAFAGADGSEQAAQAAVREWNGRLETLAGILDTVAAREPGRLLHDLDRWCDALRRLDASARPAPRTLLTRLAEHHAALWQLLAQWLDAPDESAPTAHQQFRETVERTRLLWRVGLDDDAERPTPHAVTAPGP